MGYKPLSLSTAVDYIKSNISNYPHLPPDAPLQIREITDGYVNLIYVIEAQTPIRQSILIKQALPYMKRLGPSKPLNIQRNRIEAQALLFYNEISPGLCPEVYGYDPIMHLIVMEHLKAHAVLGSYLEDRRQIPHFISKISTFLAQTAFFSSDFYLQSEKKKDLQKTFINPAMCKMMEDLVFTHPFMEHEDNKWDESIDREVRMVRANRELKLKIAELKYSFMTSAQTLIHGDLHTDSVMVTSADTRVIDPEFAFIGPTAYDIGAMITNLTLYCLTHHAYTLDPDMRAQYQKYLLDAIRDIWNQFVTQFTTLSNVSSM